VKSDNMEAMNAPKPTTFVDIPYAGDSPLREPKRAKASTKTSEVVQRDVTIRVKPAVRHVVTKGEIVFYADGVSSGSGGTLCEVTSEEAANEIARALELLYAPRRYAVVQRSFEPGNCIVYYAYAREQAEQFRDVLQKFYQTDFRIYEQPITDLREAENFRLGGAGPREYLMVRDGQLMLTHVHEANCKPERARTMFHFAIPEGASQEEAMELVNKLFEGGRGRSSEGDKYIGLQIDQIR
jgi:hypothetical protein